MKMNLMRFVTFCLIALSLGAFSFRATAGTATTSTVALDLAVDPRVELVSIVFRLAGNPEYNRCRIPSYSAAIDKHFQPVQGHALVALARRLRQTHGVSYDAPMGLAVRLPALGEWKTGKELKVSTDGLDKRWTPEGLKEFLALLPEFVKDAQFEAFLKKNETLFSFTVTQARKVMAEAHMEWFEKFYGKRQGLGFHFVPALANGPNCYGASNKAGGREEMYCVLGVWGRNLLGMPSFDEGMLETVAHEFSHSYCNPIVDAHMAELKEAGERMFPAIEKRMASQAYGQWQTVMYESMVRAAEVRYAADTKGPEAEKRAIQDQAGRGFTWVGGLAGRLQEYEAHRDRYPTLNEFFPEIVKFFDQASREVAAAGAKVPKVVRTIPANKETGVDPALKELTVVFDREMSPKTWAWTGGPPDMPEIPRGAKAYWKDSKTCVLPVKMEPGRTYRFGINGGSFTGFRGIDGTPAESAAVTFKTK